MLQSIDRYVVGKKDETTLLGIIIEDKPGEYLIIEDEAGDTWAISYDEIEFVRLYIENPLKNLEVITDDAEDKDEPPDELPQEIIPEVLEDEALSNELPPLGYSSSDLSLQLKGLSIYSLNHLELDPWKVGETDLNIRNSVYNDSIRDDTLKFTLLNIVPGLGSILQGDYYSGLYTLTSVLGAVAYNLASPDGTDLTFIVNLNGAVAYLSSFFAPYRYNSKYNNLLKEKLDIAD